jgi:hypothetical protein
MYIAWAVLPNRCTHRDSFYSMQSCQRWALLDLSPHSAPPHKTLIILVKPAPLGFPLHLNINRSQGDWYEWEGTLLGRCDEALCKCKAPSKCTRKSLPVLHYSTRSFWFQRLWWWYGLLKMRKFWKVFNRKIGRIYIANIPNP